MSKMSSTNHLQQGAIFMHNWKPRFWRLQMKSCFFYFWIRLVVYNTLDRERHKCWSQWTWLVAYAMPNSNRNLWCFYELDISKQNFRKILIKIRRSHSRKYIWKCRLQKQQLFLTRSYFLKCDFRKAVRLRRTITLSPYFPKKTGQNTTGWSLVSTYVFIGLYTHSPWSPDSLIKLFD